MSDALFELDAAPQPAATERTRLLVHFRCKADRQAFAVLIGQPIGASTQSLSYPVANRVPADFFEGAEDSDEASQSNLLEVPSNWKDVWRGMPAYSQQELRPFQSVEVYFDAKADRVAFARLIKHSMSAQTKYVWFPPAASDDVIGLRWKSTRPQNPKYPVYVPTKGRWESAFTIKCMERLGIRYFAVVQPQERHHYEPVVKTGTMLLLPEGLDGLVPTRNWILEHSIAAGAERHWQLDDNIKSFFRYHKNRQIHVADGTCMRIAEDFTDRYENVAISGFQYFMFVPRKHGDFPPYVFNTRVYSNSLINNSIPFRYRDVYNDDTDICLRALKAGWCTVQFNAFLAWKQPTMVVKGGNTPIYLGAEKVAADWVAHATTCKLCTPDESPATCEEGRAILQRDGRWRMAESLLRQHPDVTTITRRWNRWQHMVDYRRFKKNVPVMRPDVVLPAGQDEYGLELVEVAQARRSIGDGPRPAKQPKATTVQVAPQAGPSVLDFLAALPPDPPKPAPAPAPAPRSESPEPRPEPAEASKPLPPEPLPEPAGPAEPEPIAFDAAFFRDYLYVKGHRLLLREGKFFVSDASTLTEPERAEIKRHRDELIKLAEPWVEPPPPAPPLPPQVIAPQDGGSLFASPQAGQTLAQFLGSEPPRVDPNYKNDEPPDLDGIDEIVLNFATNGLDWIGGHRPIGLTVGTLDGQLMRFLPFRFAGGNLDEERVKEWARRKLRGKKIVNAKTKFDVHMSREWGVDLEEQGCTFSDVHHTAALLDDHRKRFALDVLDEDYFPNEPKTFRVAESVHEHHDAAAAAARELYTARLIGRLLAVMRPQITEQDLGRVQALEDAVIPVVVEMERNGSPIDMDLLEKMSAECRDRHGELMLEISREAGFAFEHTASGWKRLIESLHLQVPDGFSEGELNGVDHPLIRKGQRASQIASLESKIFKAYPNHIRDGILRYNINQLVGDDGGTVSGRFSIGIVQQVPNHDNHHAAFGIGSLDDCVQGECVLFPRRLFVPGSGEYLQEDAAQIEFRLLVHYSGNESFVQAYRDDPRMSFHKKMQQMLLVHKPDMLYTHTKSYNFAAQYGARSIKLAIMMGFITDREGDEIRAAKRWNDPRLDLIHSIEAAYKRAHPEAGDLLDYASHLAKPKCDRYCKLGDKLHRTTPHRGFVKTYLGRRSRFPNAFKTYIGLNRVLQGTGADIMKQKLVEVHAERKTTGFVMRITNHDAMLGDATQPDTLAKVDAILNRQSFPLKVPILWEGGTGRNWAEAK